MGRQNSWTDQKTEEIIGTLLRAGVTLAASVVLAGGLLYLVRHGGEPADYKVFRGEPTDLRQVGSIVRDAVTRRSRGIIQLGILLLIATPIARVVFAVFAFAKERDKMYVVFTLIVLAILMYSLIGSS
jgi:uncharacterized membrane protein